MNELKENIKTTIIWHPVAKIMPQKGFCVLLCSKSGEVSEGCWAGEEGLFNQFRWDCVRNDTTHWAALPKPDFEENELINYKD